MHINTILLDKCPLLSDYEKELLTRITIEEETQASVARSYGKSPSTISIQFKKASKRFNSWLAKREREKAATEGVFDKRVFKMFNQGLPPNIVIAKLGRTDDVLNLWEKFCAIRKDDYSCAVTKITEYGLRLDENSTHPLTEQLDSLIGQNRSLLEEMDEYIRSKYALENKLAEFEKTVESLKRKNTRKDRRIEGLATQNQGLLKLIASERLTYKNIETGQAFLRKLNATINKRTWELNFLDTMANKARYVMWDLQIRKKEAVKDYIAQMPENEVLDLLMGACTSKFLRRYIQSWTTT